MNNRFLFGLARCISISAKMYSGKAKKYNRGAIKTTFSGDLP